VDRMPFIFAGVIAAACCVSCCSVVVCVALYMRKREQKHNDGDSDHSSEISLSEKATQLQSLPELQKNKGEEMYGSVSNLLGEKVRSETNYHHVSPPIAGIYDTLATVDDNHSQTTRTNKGKQEPGIVYEMLAKTLPPAADPALSKGDILYSTLPESFPEPQPILYGELGVDKKEPKIVYGPLGVDEKKTSTGL